MHGVHCHVAAVCKEWPPELVLALKEAKKKKKKKKKKKEKKKKKKREWSIERIIEMLDVCGFGMANNGISVILTLRLIELSKGVRIIEVVLYYNGDRGRPSH